MNTTAQINRPPSLKDQIAKILMQRIKNGIYPRGSQIPTEVDLAEEFSVSRTTVRNSISILSARGLVKSKQGSGTYVRNLSKISKPIYEIIDFNELIENNGWMPGCYHVSSKVGKPDETTRHALGLEADNQIAEIHKIFTANDEPVIYVVNHLPVWIFEDQIPLQEITNPNLTEPLYEFLEDVCHQRIEYFLGTLRPVNLKDVLIEKDAVSVDPYQPLLEIVEVGYREDDRPLLLSSEYFLSKEMSFEIIKVRGPHST